MDNRDIVDIKLNSLAKSKFRSGFKLRDSEKKYIYDKGMDKIVEHAYYFVNKRLVPRDIMNDGKQTPMRGIRCL